ncbi:MAG: hypothetical protein M0R06_18320 [Sphaerochaeta sp.]|jgi:hypothetical protein|nr:hypothetical protein [Sphaerochaeta sp.]
MPEILIKRGKDHTELHVNGKMAADVNIGRVMVDDLAVPESLIPIVSGWGLRESDRIWKEMM